MYTQNLVIKYICVKYIEMYILHINVCFIKEITLGVLIGFCILVPEKCVFCMQLELWKIN